MRRKTTVNIEGTTIFDQEKQQRLKAIEISKTRVETKKIKYLLKR